GCYVGQEVVSRMKMSGKVNWLICLVECPQDLPGAEITLPQDLVSPEAPDAVVGQWTSVAPIQPESSAPRLGLALVKKAFSDPDVHLSIGNGPEGDGGAVEVVLRVCEFPANNTEPLS
ncbi:MAG: hypothetical protein AAF514_22265, partial [Verrucomicrobiota bacterium]